MKMNWNKIWLATKSVLSALVTICAIAFFAIMTWYYLSAGSTIAVHDTGTDRVMNVYSQTGELLETYEGYIGIKRMDGDTVVYEVDGTCVTVQGAIVTVKDEK